MAARRYYHSGNNDRTSALPATAQDPPQPWYNEAWFVIVLIVLILVLLFVIAVIFVRRCGPSEPNIRQRMPLPYRQDKVPRSLFLVGAENGNVVDAARTSSTTGGHANGTLMYQGPGIGVVNPAFQTPPTTPHQLRHDQEAASLHSGSSSPVIILGEEEVEERKEKERKKAEEEEDDGSIADDGGGGGSDRGNASPCGSEHTDDGQFEAADNDVKNNDEHDDSNNDDEEDDDNKNDIEDDNSNDEVDDNDVYSDDSDSQVQQETVIFPATHL